MVALYQAEFYCCSLKCLNYISYFTTPYWSGSGSFHLSFCLSLCWLYVYAGILPLLPKVCICHFRYATLSSSCEFALSLLSHCHSLMWICFILVPVSLTIFAFHGLICTSAAHWGRSVSFKLYHQCSLRWLCFLPRCPTANSWGGSLS